MAFQLGGEKKLLTSCQHEVAGPPLKSYIFNDATEKSAGEGDRLKSGHDFPGVGGVTKSTTTSKLEGLYCENICKAVAHVRKTFPGMENAIRQQRQQFDLAHRFIMSSTQA